MVDKSGAPGTRGTTIVVVDGSALDRELLCRAIESHTRVAVAVGAATTDEAVRLIDERMPGLALLKVGSPGVEALEILQRLRRGGSATSVLVIGPASNEALQGELMRAGASCYHAATRSMDQLIESVRRLCGEGVGTAGVGQSSRVAVRGRRSRGSGAGLLSARETDVLRLIAGGLTSKAIGSQLGVSPRTVDCHRMRIMQKIGVHKVADLVRFAVREGVVSAWDEFGISSL